MNIIGLVNGFLSYVILMVVTAGIAFLGGFIGISLRKNKNAKKQAENGAK